MPSNPSNNVVKLSELKGYEFARIILIEFTLNSMSLQASNYSNVGCMQIEGLRKSYFSIVIQ